MDDKTPMLFDKLEIERARWGKDSGKLTGSVRFSSEHASITVIITEEHAAKITDMFADALMETATEMAEVVRGDIIEALPLERKAIK